MATKSTDAPKVDLSKAHAVSILAGILMIVTAGVAFADAPPDLQNSDFYFGQIQAPCGDKDGNDGAQNCKNLTKLLACASDGVMCDSKKHEAQCAKIDEPCVAGEEILQMLYGKIYRPNLADFVVYFGDRKQGDNNYTLAWHRPTLMWQGKNTPHVMGINAIYIVAFASNQLDLDAHVSSESQYQPNPFVGLLGGAKVPDSKAPDKQLQSAKSPFVWYNLSGDRDKKIVDDRPLVDEGGKAYPVVHWVGLARGDVTVNSIDRVTISYNIPKPTDAGGTDKQGADKKKNATAQANAGGDKQKGNTAQADADGDKYRGDFLAQSGHFSNSPDSVLAVSFALGATFNSKNTSISSGGSSFNIDGFMFAKYYIRPPYLNAYPGGSRYRRSFGLVLGTNVNSPILNDLVLGVSFGHLINNVGLIVGVNSVAGIANSNQGRKNRGFLGLEYTF